MKFKCIIFDLDGTLVDTIKDIAASMNYGLESRGFPAPSLEKYTKIVGQGIRKLASLALPPSAQDDQTVDAVTKEALSYYKDHPAVYAAPYPGIVEVVTELRMKKVKTAVLSNKADSISKIIIAKLFPPNSFDMVIGEQPNVPRKPDPTSTWDILTEMDVSPREALFVGDSEIDVATAHAAECSALGVSWGFRGRKILENAGADRIIDSPAEIIELMNIRYS
ncbi:HAD family hydrolase [Treponema primitia]|nr:HAD family hydrolase [Treponema primitia]